MVYSWKQKRLAEQIYTELNLDSSEKLNWGDFKNLIKELRPDLNLKIINWCAHLCLKKHNKKKSSIFEYYLNKVLTHKAMFKKLVFEPLQSK